MLRDLAPGVWIALAVMGACIALAVLIAVGIVWLLAYSD